MKTAIYMALLVQMRLTWPQLPKLPGACLGDAVYECPSLKELNIFLHDTWFEKYAYTLERFDCDNYAKILSAFVEQERYKTQAAYQWALGEIRGEFVNGPARGGHAMNFCLTSDAGMVLIEPQNDGIFRPDPGDLVRAYWL
jgi:hypothetical protein